MKTFVGATGQRNPGARVDECEARPAFTRERLVSSPAHARVPSALQPTLGALPSEVETVAATGARRSSHAAETLAAAAATDGSTLPPAHRGPITVLPRVVAEDRGQLRLEHETRSRYQAQRPLGAGGMGEVELSEDRDIGRWVALKRLPAARESASTVARFVDEVRTLGSLDHPNITPIYDVGRDEEGRLFFTMKYVEGDSLEELIERLAAGDPEAHARYPLARRLDVFVGILHALDYAHAQGILHRDIKPANIMLGVHGEVRLMDWGIARRQGSAPDEAEGEAEQLLAADRPSVTHDGFLLGTPLYMSPEQAHGDKATIGPRSDLYSAFVVLYELLTLRRYIEDDSDLYSTLQEVVQPRFPRHDPEAWRHPHQPPVPIELRYFLAHGLQVDPEQRFASAADALAVLERLRSGEIHVECAVTFFKSKQQRLSAFADSRPRLFLSLMATASIAAASLAGLAAVGVASLL